MTALGDVQRWPPSSKTCRKGLWRHRLFIRSDSQFSTVVSTVSLHGAETDSSLLRFLSKHLKKNHLLHLTLELSLSKATLVNMDSPVPIRPVHPPPPFPHAKSAYTCLQRVRHVKCHPKPIHLKWELNLYSPSTTSRYGLTYRTPLKRSVSFVSGMEETSHGSIQLFPKD